MVCHQLVVKNIEVGNGTGEDSDETRNSLGEVVEWLTLSRGTEADQTAVLVRVHHAPANI